MFLPLTDLLSCPRCGDDVGLILLADRIEDRRVLEGALGCPRCQERFPVRDGFADLRSGGEMGGAGTAGAPGAPSAAPRDEELREGALRFAALLGLLEGAGYVLLAGGGVVMAPALAALIEGLEVVALDPVVATWPEERGVSRIGAVGALPLYSGSMRGVVLTGGAESLLEEAARVLVPGGRLVVEPASTGAAARAEAAGLQVRVREGEVLVAVRS
jgi:uncharacterized protein YbaR (Trm112 family)